ncbi:MAG: hypothetical protein ACYCUI_15260 [Vulcanimicrobiaceae bacterium]
MSETYEELQHENRYLLREIVALKARVAELEKECIANPADEADKPKLGDDDSAKQYASDTLSGRAPYGRFPWGQRNLARAYLNAMNRIAELESAQCRWRDAVEDRPDDQEEKIVLTRHPCGDLTFDTDRFMGGSWLYAPIIAWLDNVPEYKP